ncbi:hypothetical protein GJAV_G00106330 [Gymnothorax javanicus]|nr:hypothetical protein GJAV_G00106330 [Gymnothorax javanicus]
MDEIGRQDESETSGPSFEENWPAMNAVEREEQSMQERENGGSWENGGREEATESMGSREINQAQDWTLDGETGRETRDEAVGDMEEELLVLDPEHPLMKGFQAALKTHLQKQLDGLDNELRELRSIEHAEEDGRREVGTALYKVQEELGRIDTKLKAQSEANASAASERQSAQEQLEDVRRKHRSALARNDQLQEQVSQLQTEVDDVALKLLYLQGASKEMSSDVAATQTCTRKAQMEMNLAAQQKNMQDLYVDRLSQQLERLVEQAASYEAQRSVQVAETQVAQEGLSEAQMELDALLVEQKQLLQQWNRSLLGVRQRDEAYNTVQEVLRAVRDQARTLDTEIGSFRRSIREEEDRNEPLTVALNSARLHCRTSRRLISRSKTQEQPLLEQLVTYTRTLEESERTLEQITADCAAGQAEVATLRAQMDREVTVRRDLEEKIMAKMQEQLSHTQAAKCTRQQVEKIAALKGRRLDVCACKDPNSEVQVARLEDSIAQVMREGAEVRVRVESLSRVWAELQKEMAEEEELLASSEAEVSKQDDIIERKQLAIANFNKKIREMCTEHKDVGSLEIQVNKLQKELEEVEREIRAQQQSWLRHQEELIQLSQDRQTQNAAVLDLQGKLTLLQQKRLHTEGEIEQERRQLAEVKRNMKVLVLDIVKLNALLSENSQQTEALEQGNSLLESDFVGRLKEAERESIDMQMDLERIWEEKDRLLNSLVEAEQQIFLWDKRTQLVKETQLAVREELDQGDLQILKSEIHRMEVRYDQLMKRQARLLRELDTAVARREAIEMHSKAQMLSARKRSGHPESHSVLQGLRRKIQDSQRKSKECDSTMSELQETQKALSSTVSEKQQQLTDLRSACSTLDAELRTLQDTKDKNRLQLVTLQGRVRHLEAVRGGKYRPLCRGGGGMASSTAQRLSVHLQTVEAIVQRVYEDCPEHQGALRLLNLAFSSHRDLHETAASR